DVRDCHPGDAVRIDGVSYAAAAFPRDLATLPPGAWVAQAVLDRNPEENSLGRGEGNAYSAPVSVPTGGGDLHLVVAPLVRPGRFPESERTKAVAVQSPLLSRFYGRPIQERAAVILPRGYDDPGAEQRRYPILYIIPGFGGRHTDIRSALMMLDHPGMPPMI